MEFCTPIVWVDPRDFMMSVAETHHILRRSQCWHFYLSFRKQPSGWIGFYGCCWLPGKMSGFVVGIHRSCFFQRLDEGKSQVHRWGDIPVISSHWSSIIADCEIAGIPHVADKAAIYLGLAGRHLEHQPHIFSQRIR